MPIAAHNRARYAADWPAISLARKELAGWRCEFCGVPHHAIVWQSRRWRGRPGRLHVVPRELLTVAGRVAPCRLRVSGTERSVWEIVLAVAHLNHQPEDNSDANLRALCQVDHLRHDQSHHASNAALTRRAIMLTGDLFGGGVGT